MSRNCYNRPTVSGNTEKNGKKNDLRHCHVSCFFDQSYNDPYVSIRWHHDSTIIFERITSWLAVPQWFAWTYSIIAHISYHSIISLCLVDLIRLYMKQFCDSLDDEKDNILT